MNIGITGHQRLDDESAWPWVESALRSALSEVSSPLIGISSLAIGADQLFAKLVLARGGSLHVVLPFPDYIETFATGADRKRYQEILARASLVETLQASPSNQESFYAAGLRVVDRSDRLLAVWTGRKAAGLGGTGDIVSYATTIGRATLHIDPVRREVHHL